MYIDTPTLSQFLINKSQTCKLRLPTDSESLLVRDFCVTENSNSAKGATWEVNPVKTLYQRVNVNVMHNKSPILHGSICITR